MLFYITQKILKSGDSVAPTIYEFVIHRVVVINCIKNIREMP